MKKLMLIVFFVMFTSTNIFAQWSHGIGARWSDSGEGIAVDGSGNVYITGYFAGQNVDFGSGKTLTNHGGGNYKDIYIAKYNSSGVCLWAHGIGGVYGDDKGLDIAVDDLGNVYITGTFRGQNVNFGSGKILSSSTNSDIYFAKYNSSGDCQWAYNIMHGYWDFGEGIAVDGSGNVYITGYFHMNPADFDPSVGGTALLPNNGWMDIYFAKYTSDGDYLWAHNIGGSSYDRGYDIAVDGSGNVYITGYFEGNNVDFGSGNTLTSIGGSNTYFAKYTTDGNYLWAHNIGCSSSGYGIELDGSSNVYITGSFDGSGVDFGLGNNLTSIGGSNTYFAKYTTDGNYLWAHNIGCYSFGYGIELDGSSNVYITGSFDGSGVDFGLGNNLTSNGSSDIYFAKYNSNGDCNWAYNIGGLSSDYGRCLAVDGSANVLITGSFKEINVDFDPGTGTTPLSSKGDNDAFIMKFAPPPSNEPPNCDLAAIAPQCADENGVAVILGADVTGITDPDNDPLTITVSPNTLSPGTTLVTVTADDENGGSCTKDINVTVNQATADAGPDATIYIGYPPYEETQLNATGGVTYSWSPEDGLSNPNIANPIANPGGTETYTVTVTDANGCSATDEVTVNVIDVRCGNNNNKVLVCHKGKTICISPNAVQTHLNNHGDYLGNCGGDQLVTLPTEYELHYNYPNPFNPMTRIDYSLPFDSKVNIQIFDVLGREVATLVNDYQNAGYYTIDFNASNLASGIYFYRMLAGDFSAIKKMVVIK